jgi:hypothetical protein
MKYLKTVTSIFSPNTLINLNLAQMSANVDAKAVEDEDALSCVVCLEKVGFILGLPCCSAGIHATCLVRHVNSSKDGKSVCPTCRENMIAGGVPLERPTSPRSISSSPMNLEDNEYNPVLCCLCNTEHDGDIVCDICDKYVCDDCLIKKNVSGRGRVDVCVKCVKYMVLIAENYDEQIQSVTVESPPLCKTCLAVPCSMCLISNNGDNFCVPCVRVFNRIYQEQDETVDGIWSSLVERGRV